MSGILRVVYENGKLEEHQESLLMPGNYGWDSFEDQPLTRMELILPELGGALLLSGYEGYNLITDRKAGEPFPRGIWLMGRLGDLIDVSYVDFRSREVRRDRLPLGAELEGVGSLGWKKGYVPKGSISGTFMIPLRQ